MASQLFGTNYEYSVIDNTAPTWSATSPGSTALNAGAPLGWDTVWPGTTTQGANPKTNGTIPDAVNRATKISTGLVLAGVKYLNPA